ncbi:MAG: thioredoxin domain-containing protein [Minisyncoccia bacterium]
MQNNNQNGIVGAIIVAGVLIAGAILLKGSHSPTQVNPSAGGNGIPITTTALAPVGPTDRTLGNPNAKVALVMYEDFQCVYCGAISGSQPNTPLIQSLKQNDPTWTPFMPEIVNNYVKNGSVLLVYRDYAFLGPESAEAAQAARCAGDQGQFWEYHDYLFAHQKGENQGAFSNPNLESFAKILGLNTINFNQCLDSGKYAQAVAASKAEGDAAGVTGTPKGFILVNGKVVSTIDGAEPWSTVQPKIDAALK